jgi:RimJ/RimL family protein N-acetyltransferase
MEHYKNKFSISAPTIRQLPSAIELLQLIPYMESYEKEQLLEKCKKAIENGRYPYIKVAVMPDGDVVGITIYDIIPSYGGDMYVFLYCIAVDKYYQRQGVGKALLNAVKEHGKNENASCVCFICHKRNIAAQRFYTEMSAMADNNWLEMTIDI